MTSDDQTTLALTEDAHRKLSMMKDLGHFAEMRDAYRLAIAVALRTGEIAPQEQRRNRTYLNAGSLDPDGTIRDIVRELLPDDGTPYQVVERLAEAGIHRVWDELELTGEVSRFLVGDAGQDQLLPDD